MLYISYLNMHSFFILSTLRHSLLLLANNTTSDAALSTFYIFVLLLSCLITCFILSLFHLSASLSNYAELASTSAPLVLLVNELLFLEIQHTILSWAAKQKIKQ